MERKGSNNKERIGRENVTVKKKVQNKERNGTSNGMIQELRKKDEERK